MNPRSSPAVLEHQVATGVQIGSLPVDAVSVRKKTRRLTRLSVPHAEPACVCIVQNAHVAAGDQRILWFFDRLVEVPA